LSLIRISLPVSGWYCAAGRQRRVSAGVTGGRGRRWSGPRSRWFRAVMVGVGAVRAVGEVVPQPPGRARVRWSPATVSLEEMMLCRLAHPGSQPERNAPETTAPAAGEHHRRRHWQQVAKPHDNFMATHTAVSTVFIKFTEPDIT
jgi:hypothetical protein